MRRIRVRVSPKSSRAGVEEKPDIWIVRVHAPAEDGRANEAVIEAIAHHLGTAKSRIRIVRGHASRLKLIEVDE